jgi:bifunctional non-homologous end joining protein LigD
LDFIPPQLATPREDVPEGSDWIHEIKHDGYRMLGYVGDGEPRLLSRNNLDWSLRFAEVTTALKSLRAKQAIVDGEICVLDGRGRSDFGALQAMVEEGRRASLTYLIFDLLWLDGQDLRDQPLLNRKARLARLVPKRHRVLRYVDHIKGGGVGFFIKACEAGLEGVISKRADSPYTSGRTTS